MLLAQHNAMLCRGLRQNSHRNTPLLFFWGDFPTMQPLKHATSLYLAQLGRRAA